MDEEAETKVLDQIIYAILAQLHEEGADINALGERVIKRVMENKPHSFLATALKSEMAESLREITSHIVEAN